MRYTFAFSVIAIAICYVFYFLHKHNKEFIGIPYQDSNHRHPNRLPPYKVRNWSAAKALLYSYDADACRETMILGGVPYPMTADNRTISMAGNYTLCMDPGVRPRENDCLVYSFGINNEWSFDDSIEKSFGCEVFSFDPSMNERSHKRSKKITYLNIGISDMDYYNERNWTMFSLNTIVHMLKHEDKIIDILKIDVEHAEHRVISHIAKLGLLETIKQIAIEIHSFDPEQEVPYSDMYAVQWILEQFGFVKFFSEDWPLKSCYVRTSFEGEEAELGCFIHTFYNRHFHI